MVLGFFLAALAGRSGSPSPSRVALELFVGAMIRDNLTLNVLMFVWPLDSVLHWQQGTARLQSNPNFDAEHHARESARDRRRPSDRR